MIRPTYLILGVLIATALTHGLGSLDRAVWVRLVQFTRDLPTYRRVLEQAKLRDAEMDGWLAECHRRDAARQEVIAALLDRRMSLLEAAARFRDLNAGSQQFTSRHLTNFR